MQCKQVLEEAAKAILSGGAHPLLPHDDHLIQGLREAGDATDVPVSLKSARNYCCDGCYEPIFPGETDFSLAYVPLLQVLEMTINHGSTYSLAGPMYLEGVPQSLPTEHAEEIKSFDKVFIDILLPFFLFIRRGGEGSVPLPYVAFAVERLCSRIKAKAAQSLEQKLTGSIPVLCYLFYLNTFRLFFRSRRSLLSTSMCEQGTPFSFCFSTTTTSCSTLPVLCYLPLSKVAWKQSGTFITVVQITHLLVSSSSLFPTLLTLCTPSKGFALITTPL